ncbi:MAG: ABC transporter permease [Elusimicrobia bacterium]|nr:ABC transporter permease [Elusimicrobiota bacterium]
MIKTLLGFISKEIAQAFRDPRMRMMIFFTPLFQLLVYGLSLSTYTQNVRLAVLARPEDAFTRRVAQRFYESRWFVPARTTGTDPVEWLRSGRAEAVLIAPPRGAHHDLGRGDAEFQLLIDAVNSVRARSIEGYARSIIETAARDEAYERRHQDLRFALRTYYNPERDTTIYLVPGILCIVMFLAVSGLTNVSLARERERGTIEMLLAAPIKPWEFVLGKTVPFICIGMLELVMGLILARLMGVPIRGSLFLIVLASLNFFFSSVCISFFVSMRVRTQQQAVFAAFFYGFPMYQLSGILFPVENMPQAISWLGAINPLHHYVEIMRHLMLKGTDLEAIIPRMAAITAFGSLLMAWILATFKHTID